MKDKCVWKSFKTVSHGYLWSNEYIKYKAHKKVENKLPEDNICPFCGKEIEVQS